MTSPIYLWLKAFHVISVIAWMAGMLYLPRLYVYHAGVAADGPEAALFKVMERRLLRYIINPAMVLTWAFGLSLAFLGHWWMAPWFHAKLVLVIVLSGFHGYLARWRRAFEQNANVHSVRFYRAINEVPTLLMIAVVILVVLKPA